MSKIRTDVPPDDAADVLFRHDHTCCICRERGKHVQIHHIDEDPSNHALENLAVLCLQCHNDTQIRGGFGRKFSAAEVTRFRDDWVTRVADRRRQADEILLQKQVGLVATRQPSKEDWRPPSELALIAFLKSIPDILKAAYDLVQPGWDGSTSSMTQASYQVVDVVGRIWIQLAEWYPPNHFGKPAAQYLSDYVAARVELRYALMEPDGPRSRGTMIRPMVAYGAMLDAQELLILTVRMLSFDYDETRFSIKEWEKQIRALEADHKN